MGYLLILFSHTTTHGSRTSQRADGGVGRAAVPAAAGLRGRDEGPGRRLRAADPAAGRSPAPSRRCGAAAPAGNGRVAAVRRRHHQAALHHPRRLPRRGGRDEPSQPAHRLRLVAVGLPAGMHLLRHRQHGPWPQPGRRRDRGAGDGAGGDAARAGRAGVQRGDDGHGRAVPELRRGARGLPHPQRPGRLRPGCAPDRDLDGRVGTRHRAAGGRAAAGQAGAVAARSQRRSCARS